MLRAKESTWTSYPFYDDSLEVQKVDEARQALALAASDHSKSYVEVSKYAHIFQMALIDLHRAQDHFVATRPFDYVAKQDRVRYYLEAVPNDIKARIGGEARMYDPMVMRHAKVWDQIQGKLVYYWNIDAQEEGEKTLHLIYVADHTPGAEECMAVTKTTQGELYPITVNVTNELFIYLIPPQNSGP